jgi:hypothetical protein
MGELLDTKTEELLDAVIGSGAPAAVEALRQRIIERINAWKDYAEHLQHCRWCSEDGVENCFEGNEARKRAEEIES